MDTDTPPRRVRIEAGSARLSGLIVSTLSGRVAILSASLWSAALVAVGPSVNLPGSRQSPPPTGHCELNHLVDGRVPTVTAEFAVEDA